MKSATRLCSTTQSTTHHRHRCNGALQTPEPDPFSSHVSALRLAQTLPQASLALSLIVASSREQDHYLSNLLLLAYDRCGALVEDSYDVFSRSHLARNVFSWSIMIQSFINDGDQERAFQMFHQMHVEGIIPDNATFVTMLSGLDGGGCLLQGVRMHTCLLSSCLQSNVVTGTALVGMYSRCGSFEQARRAFDAMTIRNVVSWTTFISAYCHAGHVHDALLLFPEMQASGYAPNEITYIILLHACTCEFAVTEGRLLHSCIAMEAASGREIHVPNAFMKTGAENSVAVDNALVTMYCKCTSPEDGWAVFAANVDRDVVSWTAILALCVQHGRCHDAFRLLDQMQTEGNFPDRVVFLNMLDACILESSLIAGKRIHLHILSSALVLDVVLGTALVHMYGKCGNPDEAIRVFNSMAYQNLVTWNALIAAYALQGNAEQALQLLDRMVLGNVSPDTVTFSTILSVCNHGGLVEEGCKYALKICRDYSIQPSVEHYNCLVGLLGRVGLVKEGGQLVNSMPIQPNTSCWALLLASLQTHETSGEEKDVMDHVFELNPETELLYVMSSDLLLFDG